MKKNLLSTFCCLCILIFSKCYGQNKNSNSLETIDIEANMKKMEIMNLSQFYTDLVYIPLETKEGLPLRYIDKIDISENNILVSDNNVCLLYDRKGHFISKIGNKGRGPEEYQYESNVGFGAKKKIYLASLFDLFQYSQNGSFLNKYSKCFLIKENFYIEKWIIIDDSLIFGHVTNSSGLIEYKAIIFNKKGQIKYSFKNYSLFKRDKPTGGREGMSHIYRFKNEIYYKGLFNDTLFSLTKTYQLTPKYNFYLGKFKEPDSERAKIVGNDLMRYFHLYSVFQTSNYLFLDCSFGNQFPAMRLTPKQYSVQTVKPNWYNTTNALGIFDKGTHKLIFCKPTSTDNPLFTSGLYNDIDAGPRFFPKRQVNDSTMAMWIDVKQLKDHVNSSDFINNIPKHPEMKKKLEELAKSLNEFDNPILIFVTFKK